MSELTSTRVRDAADRLGLMHLPGHVADLVTRTEVEQPGYFDVLDLVLGEEVERRKQCRFRNTLKLSDLPHRTTLASLEFIEARSNIALLGPPGVGRTHTAVALAVAACQVGYSIYFTSLDDLVRKLQIAEATGRFERQLNALLRPSVLVIDEVGYLRLEREEANMFFQLISRRYERGSMIITSNKPFNE